MSSKETLEIEKLRMEIKILKKQIDDQAPKAEPWYKKAGAAIKDNLGKISAFIILVGGIMTPLLHFYADERQAHLVNINADLLTQLNTSANLSREALNKLDDTLVPGKLDLICTKDPKLVAPYILQLLSDGRINYNKAIQIYERMYIINSEQSHYTFWDSVLFFIFKDNKQILEQVLADNATIEFNKDISQDDEVGKMETYINIINRLGLHTRLENTLNIITTRAKADSNFQELQRYAQNNH